MTGQNQKRILLLYVLLVTALTIGIMTSLVMGSAGFMPEPVILYRIRLPRTLMAVVLGGALALSGYLLQTYFRNPIAGPYILGIASGAKLFSAVCLIFLTKAMAETSSVLLILSSFAGAALSTAFIILLSSRVRNLATLLVGGIMVNYICSAITELCITFAADADIVNLHNWSQGSFAGANLQQCRVAFVIVFLSFGIVFSLCKPIYAIQMGEDYAASLGIRTGSFRRILILIACFLAATVTAFAGPISFVGIAVPFLVKAALGTSKPMLVIPASFLGGGVFCVVCDTIARCLLAPVELNISTVTAVFGAPIVILMLVSRRRG